MSAADVSPSRPSMITKYTTGTTTVTTALTHVIFSSNGTAASLLRLTRCQKCLTSCTVKGSRHDVNYLLLRDGVMREPALADRRSRRRGGRAPQAARPAIRCAGRSRPAACDPGPRG